MKMPDIKTLKPIMVVRHAKGERGLVMLEDGKRKRPKYLVVTDKGEKVWWFADRCKNVNEAV